ncbi:hypothetical protein [Vreelandella glaciei]|uniref:hypothetical protein n=1 Tax=Vreelandella glaciei TaxID=186761 RepID=UPI0030013C32
MSEYSTGVLGQAVIKDGKHMTASEIVKALSEGDEYRNHLAAIAEMTGNSDDIGAAHEGVNALVEDREEVKRLRTINHDLCNALERTLERENALAAHVEQLTSIAEKISTVAPEYLDHLAADATFVLRSKPAASLAYRDRIQRAEELESLRLQDRQCFAPGSVEDERAIGYNRCVEQARQTAAALRLHAEGHQ